MENTSARNMWGDFLDIHLENAFKEVPKVVRFAENGLDADQVAKLVVNGAKRANSFSLLGLQYRNEPLPHIGDFMVVTDWEGNAKCIVRTTAVKLRPFFNITEDYARSEGYDSLPQWKESHWELFTKELAPYGRVPRESMIVVCQSFEKVF
ncbi:ASCH domain-containing protein [Flavobacteriaceae bacterium F89]|uniref:ASCH domain-containing protein n=1 Tax=Cerina litoralis TaxID=2874477 RepID=A0AAE3EQD3_9FLAO|nr:ASCH domain-containing protein [Cerina litoralis]